MAIRETGPTPRVDQLPNGMIADTGDGKRVREKLSPLQQSLVKENLPLGRNLARRFAGKGEPIEDLEQVAALAMSRAAQRFDPERNVKFSTYATVTIVGELKRHFRDDTWEARVPRRVKVVAIKMGHEISELEQDLQREPNTKEVAERMGITENEVEEAQQAVVVYKSRSFEAMMESENGQRAFDPKESRQKSEDEVLQQMILRDAIARLPEERDRKIIEMRFYEGMTQQKIADELGLSQMHVSRLLKKAGEKIKALIGTEEMSTSNVEPSAENVIYEIREPKEGEPSRGSVEDIISQINVGVITDAALANLSGNMRKIVASQILNDPELQLTPHQRNAVMSYSNKG